MQCLLLDYSYCHIETRTRSLSCASSEQRCQCPASSQSSSSETSEHQHKWHRRWECQVDTRSSLVHHSSLAGNYAPLYIICLNLQHFELIIFCDWCKITCQCRRNWVLIKKIQQLGISLFIGLLVVISISVACLALCPQQSSIKLTSVKHLYGMFTFFPSFLAHCFCILFLVSLVQGWKLSPLFRSVLYSQSNNSNVIFEQF